MSSIVSLLRRLLPRASLTQSVKMVQPGTLTFDEVRSGLENDSLVYIDVRNRSELESDGKIVGSVNVPLPEIGEAFAKEDKEFVDKYGFSKPSKDASNLVVGCLAGKRAAAAAEQLVNLGYTNLKVFPGSFSEWRAKEGPITK